MYFYALVNSHFPALKVNFHQAQSAAHI